MFKPFLNVASLQETLDKIEVFSILSVEQIDISHALSRVTYHPITSTEDLPEFNRSTMDGFAVRARDTFGVSESSPGMFEIAGEVRMGEISSIKLTKNQAVRIWTGGALPEGSDAVVMIEHTEEINAGTIEVLKSVAPFEHVVRRGEDFAKGQELIPAHHRLRPADIGLLASLGLETISVFRKPRVAVISSGDEIVSIGAKPRSGSVRDINRYTISSMTEEAGCVPVWIGIAGDTVVEIQQHIYEGLDEADVVVVSGGSSMGSRDHVIEVIHSQEDSEVLVHGVSISPGKPFILARIGKQPVIGLPGHPVSAMICFDQLVIPLLRHLAGESSAVPIARPTVEAVLSRNTASKEGRTDFVRVSLRSCTEGIVAEPISAKSGVISGMVKADGIFIIPSDCEGFYQGELVKVHLFSQWSGEYHAAKRIPGYETSSRCATDVFGTSEPTEVSRAGTHSCN